MTWMCRRHPDAQRWEDEDPCGLCEQDRQDHEARIRADERAKAEARIVAWLRGCSRGASWNIADAIERGEHEKRDR